MKIPEKNDYSYLFNSMNTSGSNSGSGSNLFNAINLSDYSSIKTGAYGKLLKAYYAETAVDKVDSGNLTVDEILNPTGWILIGFLMDPRTGLGRWRNFTIPNYKLMEELIDACRTMTTDEILNLSDVKERIEVYNEQTEKFKEMVKAHTRIEKDVIITDLRGVDPIYTGNRFMIYSLYPEQNISAWIVNGKGGKGCSAAVGYSIINRTSNVDVGSLMLKYGGGGHKKVGTCQFSDENMDEMLPKMLDELVNYQA